jgi:hypothetical protein
MESILETWEKEREIMDRLWPTKPLTPERRAEIQRTRDRERKEIEAFLVDYREVCLKHNRHVLGGGGDPPFDTADVVYCVPESLDEHINEIWENI